MSTVGGPAGRGLRGLTCAALLGITLALTGGAAAEAAGRRAPAAPAAAPADRARQAFYKGDLLGAYALAGETGERWIGGLAAYRLKNYADAFRSFAAVADDRAQTDAARAAAGFWAARAADRQGASAQGAPYLKAAAAYADTFYGVIAQRRLALLSGAASTTPTFAGLPAPELAPMGGFTVAKALVYAIVLRESRFDAGAKGGGALGLMQVTPATAAHVMGDDKLARDPSRLHEAGFNLRVGQDYLSNLLGAVRGDLVRAVAAYNSGPASILKTSAQLGDATDSLLLLESLPGAQVRDYAQKVMLNYWRYRGQLGQPTSPTLDAAAGDGKLVLAALDD